MPGHSAQSELHKMAISLGASRHKCCILCNVLAIKTLQIPDTSQIQRVSKWRKFIKTFLRHFLNLEMFFMTFENSIINVDLDTWNCLFGLFLCLRLRNGTLKLLLLMFCEVKNNCFQRQKYHAKSVVA